jgi:hypothetical protein
VARPVRRVLLARRQALVARPVPHPATRDPRILSVRRCRPAIPGRRASLRRRHRVVGCQQPPPRHRHRRTLVVGALDRPAAVGGRRARGLLCWVADAVGAGSRGRSRLRGRPGRGAVEGACASDRRHPGREYPSRRPSGQRRAPSPHPDRLTGAPAHRLTSAPVRCGEVDPSIRRYTDTTTQRHGDTTTPRHERAPRREYTTTPRHRDTSAPGHLGTGTRRHRDTSAPRSTARSTQRRPGAAAPRAVAAPRLRSDHHARNRSELSGSRSEAARRWDDARRL